MKKMRGENPGPAPASAEGNAGKEMSQQFVQGTVFGAKQDDPLIKAQTEKKVNEQKGQLE